MAQTKRSSVEQGHGAPSKTWEVTEPNTLESFIPVVGPAWDAAYNFDHGHPFIGALDTAFAVADVAGFADPAIWAGRAAVKHGIEHGLTKKVGMSWTAARTRHRAAGVIRKSAVQNVVGKTIWQEGHHAIIPRNGWGKAAPDWLKNASWNIKSLEQETHRRITGAFNGHPRFNPIERTWVGTPDHVKKGAVAAAAHGADAVIHHAEGRRHGR